MTEPNNYQDWILETIDSLRSRKARPDLERICRMVRRRHGSDPDRTRAELDKLIQSQTVLKVSYKGSISYRNAAKVLRKSRKKSELVACSGGSSRQEHLSNSGDSAHSFTDPDQEEASVGSGGPKLQSDSALSSGCNRATTAPDEQRASASSTDSGFGQQREGCSPPSRVGHETSAYSGNATPRGDDSHRVDSLNNATCNLPSQRHTSLKPKLRNANSAVGEGLVASARSLSAANRGHMKPLGLKDILGYLSSQERLCDEKLTRGKVKVVMERGAARGRLRRTRCGNITLPLRGAALDEPTDRGEVLSLLLQENARTVSEDKEWSVNKEDQAENVPLSYEEDAGISPVAMTTNPELIEKSTEDAGIQTTSKQQQQPWAKEESRTDSPNRKLSVQVQQASPTALPEKSYGTSNQEVMKKPERSNPTFPGFSNLEDNKEIDESSCLLTPTASPTDSGLSDESGGFPRCDGLSGNLIDWTVSDVVSYFAAAGFPEQAVAFRTQEIDGKSLLLMQRNDVLTGLSIRLGPALKIYEHHVKALQKTHFEDVDL